MPHLNPLQTKCESQSAEDTRSPSRSLSLDNRRLVETLAQVKHQMPDTVDEVIRERETQQELNTVVQHRGHVSKGLRQRRALDVPAEQWGDEVGREVDVGRAGERAACNAGPGGVAEPRLVELVDAQVRRDGTVKTLVGEDVVTLGGSELRGLDGAV